MNWFKKNWFVISINVIIIFIILFITELFLYLTSDRKHPFFILAKDLNSQTMSDKYASLQYGPCVFDDIGDALYRCPAGLNYDKKPILLFGCSFAWGAGLKEKQTFYYKLANLIKRPVYNRADVGWSVQHMLYQLRRNDFYFQLPKPEYVIYLYIPWHDRRMYKYGYISKQENKYFYNYLKYNERFGKLYEEKRLQNIPYLRLWNWLVLPTFARIQESDSEKTFKLLKKHLLECRYEIDEHWGKDVKFIILDYTSLEMKKRRKGVLSIGDIQKLKQNRIDVITIADLTNTELYDDKYYIAKDDDHPNEKAWDLITPLFVEKLKELK